MRNCGGIATACAKPQRPQGGSFSDKVLPPLSAGLGAGRRRAIMSRFECAETVDPQTHASRGSLCGAVTRLVLSLIAAVSLAACAQSPVARQKAEFATASRQAMTEHRHEARRLAGVYARPRHHAPTHAAEKPTAAHGVASFYRRTRRPRAGKSSTSTNSPPLILRCRSARACA